jgi:predicted aspartyl protease
VLAVSVVTAVSTFACAPVEPVYLAPAKTELAHDRVEIPLLPSAQGSPRVKVRVNGSEGQMIVDTGAFSTLVSPELAKAATAPVRSTKIRSIDGGGNVRVPDGVARFNALSLGDLSAATFYSIDAVVLDVSVLGSEREPVAGAIGMPAFRDVLLTVDYPSQKLVIEKGSLPEVNGYDILPLRVGPKSLPMVPLAIGDRVVWTLLDTGFASGLGVPQSMARELPGLDKAVPGQPFSYYHGDGKTTRARLTADVKIGWHVLRTPIVDIGVGNTPVIGAAYLRQFVVTIDQRNRRVRFVRREITPIKTPSIVGTGFFVDLQTGVLIAIVPGSGAARAGLRIGDRLTAIESIPFDTYRDKMSGKPLRVDAVSLTYERDDEAFDVRVPITVLVP